MTRIVLIDGHPDPDRERFGHALADAYARGAAEGGHKLRRIELATLDFPMLRSAADWSSQPPAAIAGAQETLRWAEHLVFVYPIWMGDMPALLKAFLEQAFRYGFAMTQDRLPKGLLGGRSARLVVTMGAPAFFYRLAYGGHSVKSFDRSVLRLAGIKPVAWSLVGNTERDAAARERWLRRMRALGTAGA